MTRVFFLMLVFAFVALPPALAGVSISLDDSDGVLDANSTVAGPGESFTVNVNLGMTAGEVVGGITILPAADKAGVLKMTGRSILSATLTDPTADIATAPNLNPQSAVDVGVTTLNVNSGAGANETVMRLTLTVDPGTQPGAYPITLSLAKARWATIGANSVSAAADTGASVYTIYAPGAEPPVLVSAVSQRTHGAGGDWNIPLPTAGNVGVECRQDGPTRLVLTYDRNIGGTPAIGLSAGVLGPVTIAGNQLTVNLTGVPDGTCLAVSVNGVADAQDAAKIAPGHAVKVRALFCDVNSSGAVNAGDIGFVKQQSLQPLGAGNFRMDVNASGAINAGDIGFVKSRSLLIVPQPCGN